MKEIKPKIYAVVVFYNPEIELIEEAYKSIIPQVDNIVYVDNNSINVENIRLWAETKEKISIILLDDNVGLASAQNKGIECALNQGADHVVILDHDSVMASDFVSSMYDIEQICIAAGIKVGLVSPVYKSMAGYDYPVTTYKNNKVYKINAKNIMEYTEVSHSIASGQLFRKEVFEENGLMKDSYFIDMIDFEYCFRIKMKGYKCILTNRACMTHVIGDQQLNMGGHVVGIYTPFRRYFTCRNSVAFAKEKYVPVKLGFHYMKLALGKLILGVIYGPNRWRQFRFCLKGFYDGIIGTSGKISIQ